MVVVREVRGQSALQVLPLHGGGIGEPGEARARLARRCSRTNGPVEPCVLRVNDREWLWVSILPLSVPEAGPWW
jgi:hypothetical protein